MLKNMKLTTKLLGSFLLMLLITAIVGAMGYRAMMGVVDRSDKSADVNTIVQLIFETRQQEKNYVIRKDDESLKKHAESIAQLLEQTKATSAKFTQQVNKDQMTAVDASVKAYQEAFQKFVDLNKQREAQLAKAAMAGRAIVAAADAMAAAQKEELSLSLEESSNKVANILRTASAATVLDQIKKTLGESQEQANHRVESINGANLIVKELLSARIDAKEFIISNGQKVWMDKIDTDIKSIIDLAIGLKSGFKRQDNIDQDDAVLAGITNYKKEFKDFAALIVAQNEMENKMVEAARNAQNTCVQAMADQKAKMQAEISSAVTFLSTTIIVAFIGGLFLAITITHGITGPLAKMVAHAETLAKGDFTSKLKINQKDEVGLMATSLNNMGGQLGTMIKAVIGSVNDLSASSVDMAAVSQQLSASARNTADKSGSVAASSEELNVNTQSVSAAMEQSSSNISMVASATEEMAATVNEIGLNTENARAISEKAVMQSHLASEKVAALGESAQKVDRITRVITEISEQTNLLALNATIEAARAGDAGKGFAVVANEIKELARQTAAATVEIKDQIDGMQFMTTSTIDDISNVSEVITDINNAINGIASAVTEQSIATNEISNNISQIAQGIAEVNENVAQNTLTISDITRDISRINTQTVEVGDSSNLIKLSAQGLSSLAEKLENMMKQFKVCSA